MKAVIEVGKPDEEKRVEFKHSDSFMFPFVFLENEYTPLEGNYIPVEEADALKAEIEILKAQIRLSEERITSMIKELRGQR